MILSVPLPFTAKTVHSIGTYGILLEKDPAKNENFNDFSNNSETTTPSKAHYTTFLSCPDSPSIYSVPHKLFEPCPVAIKPYKFNKSNMNQPTNTDVIEQSKFSNNLTVIHTCGETVIVYDTSAELYYISKVRKITLDELENLYTEAIIHESGNNMDPNTTVDMIENAMRNISITSPVVQSRRKTVDKLESTSLRRSSRHLYSPSTHLQNLTLNTPPSSGSSLKAVSRLANLITPEKLTPENTQNSTNFQKNSNPLLKSTLRSNLLKSAATESRINQQHDETQSTSLIMQLTPSYDFKTPVKSPKMTLRSGKTYQKHINISMTDNFSNHDLQNSLSMHKLNDEHSNSTGFSFPDLVLEIVAEEVNTNFSSSNLVKCCCTVDFWGDEYCAILGSNGFCYVTRHKNGRQIMSTKLPNVVEICSIDNENIWSGKLWLVCFRDGSNWLYSGLEKIIRVHFNSNDGYDKSVLQSSNILSETHEKLSCLSPIAKSPDKNLSQFSMEVSTPTTKANRTKKMQARITNNSQIPYKLIGLVDKSNLLMLNFENKNCLLDLNCIIPMNLPEEIVNIFEELKMLLNKSLMVNLYSRFLNEYFKSRNQNKTVDLCFYTSLMESKLEPNKAKNVFQPSSEHLGGWFYKFISKIW